MANINDIHSIIVPANAPVFTAHTYTMIYGGSAGCTAVVNDISVAIGAGSNINIWVRKITGGAGCFLLGENNDVFQGSTKLG